MSLSFKDKFHKLNARDLKLILSIISGVMVKFFSVISTFVTIPFTLNYLGTEQFGFWMLLIGFLSMLSFSDLGLGMGLQNSLSKCIGRNEKQYCQQYISTSYVLLTFVSLIMLFLVTVMYCFYQVGFLFDSLKTSSIYVFTFYLAFIVFVLGLPVNLILRVLNGLQFMYVGNNVMLLGHVIAFFSIFISVGLDLKIQGLVFFFLASPLFVNLLYSIYFFTKNSSMAPIFSKFNPSTLLELVQVGAWTVLSQLIYALKINAPVLIISSTLGLVVLAEFSIAHKLVTIITVIANIGLQSLWPIYGEAYSSGGKLWIINTMRKSVFYAVSLSLFFSFFIVVFGDDIFKLWIHDYNPPSTSLMVSLVFLTSLMNINVCFAVFLNGTGHFKNQSIYYSFFVFLGIVGSILFSSEYGSISVVLSMAVFTELLSIPFFYNNYKKVLSKI